MVSSQKVVATYRLPWHFKIGKRQIHQSAAAASAGDTVPCQNHPGYPSGQQPMAVETTTPRPCVRNELVVPTPGPLTPSSISFFEGEDQGVLCMPTPNTQAPVARDPSVNWVARPTLHKQDRAEADPDGEGSQNTTVLRAANPRRGPVSGGSEIWLEMEDLPTTFTLYAKFGDRVAATVS